MLLRAQASACSNDAAPTRPAAPLRNLRRERSSHDMARSCEGATQYSATLRPAAIVPLALGPRWRHTATPTSIHVEAWMMRPRSTTPSWSWALVLLLTAAAAPQAQHGAANGEWRSYGGDLGHTRYAPLDQIDARNF